MEEERRKSPRVRCYLPVRLFSQGDPKLIETLTKDLGIEGLKCLSPALKPVSRPVSLEIDLGAGEEPVSVNAQTVWFQSVPESEQFYLGISFRDLSEKDRERLSKYINSRVTAE